MHTLPDARLRAFELRHVPTFARHASEAPESDRGFWERARRIVTRLVHRAFPRLHREDVEDTVQETLVAYFENLRDGRPIANPSGLLTSIGRHKAADAWRRKVRSPLVELGEDGLRPDLEPIAPVPRQGQELAQQVLLVIFEWTRQHCERDLVVLDLLVEGKSLAEIARILGLKPDAVRQRVTRLRGSIRKHRGELGIDRILETMFEEWRRI